MAMHSRDTNDIPLNHVRCVQKCADSGFCKRLRGQQGDTYSVDPKSIELRGAVATASIKHDESGTAYDLQLTNYNGILRMHMDESASKHRFEVPWVLQKELPDSSQVCGAFSFTEIEILHEGQSVADLCDCLSHSACTQSRVTVIAVARQMPLCLRSHRDTITNARVFIDVPYLQSTGSSERICLPLWMLKRKLMLKASRRMF